MNESHLSYRDPHLHENDAGHVVKSNNVQTEIQKRLQGGFLYPGHRRGKSEVEGSRGNGGEGRGENLTLTLNAL